MIHTAFIPPIAIDNSRHIEKIERDILEILSAVTYLSAMDNRLQNIERLCRIVENRQQDLLDIILILNKRIETTMERVFDLEHAE